MTFKFYIVLVLVSLAGTCLFAQTEVAGGTIMNGHWTVSGSPYHINGNQVIENLIIDPGVIVQFTGNHKFEITGVLQAEGFYSDSIYFQSYPENPDGWKGMNFKNGAPLSSLAYCCIEDANDQGIKVDAGNLEISNCRISNNIDDGFFLRDAAIELKYCMISNNNVDGLVLDNGQISLINSIIASNGEIGLNSTNSGDQITLKNCVIADNQTNGIVCPNGILSIKNTIVYNNTAQIQSDAENTTVAFCDIEGEEVYPGTGNINVNPEFTEAGDYSLSVISSCIDAGDSISIDNDIYFPPSLGEIRNDMGVYGGPDAYGWYPPLYIVPQSVQFGGVRRDSSATVVVEVINYRNIGITATDISFEGDDSAVFSADRPNFYLPYQQQLPLSLIFTPNGTGTYSSNLVLNTATQGTVNIPIQGEGIKPDIELLLNEIRFEKVPVGELSTKTLSIRNTGGDTLNITLILPENSVYSIDPNTMVLAPDSTLDSISVGFTPDSVITYEEYLIVLSNDPDDPSLAVSLSGEGLGPVILLDIDLLEFGNIPLLSDTSLSVTILNNGNDTLRIDSLSLVVSDSEENVFTISDSAVIYPRFIEPDSQSLISIRFSPQKYESYSGQLHIYCNDSYQSEQIVSISGAGFGPDITLSTGFLDFGNIYIDTESDQTFVIKNIGNDTLTLDSLVLLQPDNDFIVEEPPAPVALDIEPNDSITVSLQFSPKKIGMASATLFIYSNDPFNEKDSVSVTGIGYSPDKNPHIELSAQNLDFGKVTINDDSIKTFIIKNTGEDTLTIENISLTQTSTVFTLEEKPSPLPFDIKPNDSTIVAVRFTPQEAGMATGTIFIFSNDPFNLKDSVRVSGSGLPQERFPEIEVSNTTIDFGRIPVNSDSLKTIYIYNLGTANLIVQLRISGQDSLDFHLENVPSDTSVLPLDSLSVVIQYDPQKTGPRQTTLLIVSNDPMDSLISLSLSGTAYDSGPATISIDHLNSTNPLISNQPADLAFVISDVSSVDSAMLFVRQGGGDNFSKIVLSYQSNMNNWQSHIDAEMITQRGIEYYIRVDHGWRSTYFPEQAMGKPNCIQVLVPDLTILKTKQGTYQMISVPLRTTGQDLNDLFGDNLGGYNKNKFRIFDCLNGSDYAEITAMNDTLPPGKALWLITKDETELDISNAKSVSTAHYFPLSLKKGWNMIATPFPFPVDWSQISDFLLPWYFEGTEWQPVSILQPYVGYALKVAADTLIMIPPNEAKLPPSKLAHVDNSSRMEWRIQLIAECGNLKDRFNYAGIKNLATSDIDRYDYPEPVPIGNYISIYFPNPVSDERYATDYRDPAEDGYRFVFELGCNIEGSKNIQLLPENLPPNLEWTVVSEETHINHGREPIQTNRNKTKYVLFVGSPDYIDNVVAGYNLFPREFSLAQNYPNPFNPRTWIKYQLPSLQHVSVSIYNILGQLVKTLIDNELKEAGYYQIQWDGTNASGEKVASGIYFLNLHSEEYNRAIKMVLQK